MSLISKIFRSEPPPSINQLLQSLSKRAERLEQDQLVATFVSLDGIEATLLNTDNRILFGRRGTGKTHVMSWVASKARAKGETAIQIDMRTVGSNSYLYNDPAISVAERATLLLRDFIQEIHQRLLEEITDPVARHRVDRFSELLDTLAGAVTEVMVRETVETNVNTSENHETSGNGTLETKISANPSFAVSGSFSDLNQRGNSEQTRITGKSRLSVNVGRVHSAIQEIVKRLGVRVWLLIDEWSTIPEELQPLLADFIKRVLFPEPKITVQIAAIEHRSRFRDERIGIEQGADAAADLTIDDHLVFENDPRKSTKFFRDLFYQHLRAASTKSKVIGNNSSEFIGLAFTQENAFNELVRASEGVPRDAINILQIAAIRAGDGKISIPHIRNSAKDWYDRDKAAFVNGNEQARALLTWIIHEVIGERKARAFLTRSDVKEETLDRLFDERILHIAKKSYSTKEEPGVRFRVWKIDYGCFVDLINTARQPSEDLLNAINKTEQATAAVPEDDLRAIRRAILDFEKYNKVVPLELT